MYFERITTGGGGGTGYVTIQENGVALPQETALNFVGASAVATDNAGVSTDVTFATNLNDIAGITPTKGILFTSDGTNITSIPVGTNDAYLVADSAQANGIRWESAYNTVEEATIALPQRAVLNFEGSAVTAVDDGINNRTNVVVNQNINDIANITLSKGGLLTDNGTNIISLPVGSNGQVLVANSGTGSGLNWASSSTLFTNPAHLLYVATNGNDSTGTGTINAPYLTVQKALSVVSGASATNPYVIVIGPGRFNETGDIILPPFTFLWGYGATASYITSSTNKIIPSSGFNSGSERCGILNLYVGGSTAINFDLVTYALGGNSCVMVLENITVNGSITMKGRVGNADFIEAYNITTFGDVLMSTANLQLESSTVAGNLTMDTAASLADSTGTVVSTQVGGNVSITSSGVQTTNMQFFASSLDGAVSLTAAGTVVLADDISLPTLKSNLTVTGATLTLTTNCYGTAYTPAVSGNWSPVPSDVADALDQLAARPASGGGLTWSVKTANTAIVKSNGYFSNGSGLIFTLPATAAVGDTFKIVNIGTSFTVAQNAGQSIQYGNQPTGTGVAGSLSTTSVGDCVEIVCYQADTSFIVDTSVGNIIVT